MSETIINSQSALNAHINELKERFEKHKYLRVKVTTGRQRTNTQNASLHLYLQHLADALNDAGYDCLTFFKGGTEIPWTMDLVKSLIWKPIQDVVIGQSSTSKAERKDYSIVYDCLNRHLIEKKGIRVMWPCLENMSDDM